MAQPEENIARRIDEVQIVGSARLRRTAVGRPVGCAEIAVLLQIPAGDILPINSDGISAVANEQRRRTGRLHHIDERPETAGHGIISPTHRAAGIRLADGATNLISAVAARAAAAGDFIPVHGIWLRAKLAGNQQ